ncbi:MAG: NUDIX domain-containing protein, partial [Chitinophagaceae bacterium]
QTVTNDSAATHGGGVVVKKENGKSLVLLVSSKKTGDWVVPKGHRDPKKEKPSELESSEETAVREVEEEAGYVAEIVAYLGETPRYTFNGESILVSYYLMFLLSDEPKPAEDRKKEWVEISRAIQMVKSEDLKRLLREVALIV